MTKWVPAGISNRHIHPDSQCLEALFGPGYVLTPAKMLSETEYASTDTVTLTGPKGSIQGVRVLGPVRNRTQVELLAGDCYVLGMEAPVLESGNPATAPITIAGPRGTVALGHGAMIAQRHIHISPQKAAEYGLEDRQIVRVHAGGVRALTFENVMIRVAQGSGLVLHIDLEEANAAGLKSGNMTEIIG